MGAEQLGNMFSRLTQSFVRGSSPFSDAQPTATESSRMPLTRRGFLKLTGAAGAGVFLGSLAISGVAHAEVAPSGGIPGELPVVVGPEPLRRVDNLTGNTFVQYIRRAGLRENPNTMGPPKTFIPSGVFAIDLTRDGDATPEGWRNVQPVLGRSGNPTGYTKEKDGTIELLLDVETANLPQSEIAKLIYDVPVPLPESPGKKESLVEKTNIPISEKVNTFLDSISTEYRKTVDSKLNPNTPSQLQDKSIGYEVCEVNGGNAVVIESTGDELFTDTVMRVDDSFVVFRDNFAKIVIGETEGAMYAGRQTGAMDWSALVGRMGLEEAEKIAQKLYDMGGSNAGDVMSALGSLPDSGVYLPVGEGVITEKITPESAHTLLGLTGVADPSAVVTYAKNGGVPRVAVTSDSNLNLGELQAVKNTDGAWEWKKVATAPLRVVNGESRKWILQPESAVRGQALDMRIYIDPMTVAEGKAFTDAPEQFNPATSVNFDGNPPSARFTIDLSKLNDPSIQNALISADTLGLPTTGITGSGALEYSLLWILATKLNQTPQQVVAGINNGTLSQLAIGGGTWFLEKGVNLMLYKAKQAGDSQALPGGKTGGLKWGRSVGPDGELNLNVFVQDSNPNPATNDPARTQATVSALTEIALALGLPADQVGNQKTYHALTKLLYRIDGQVGQNMSMSPFVQSE